jgi:uncharacterized protein (DUF2141 family)
LILGVAVLAILVRSTFAADQPSKTGTVVVTVAGRPSEKPLVYCAMFDGKSSFLSNTDMYRKERLKSRAGSCVWALTKVPYGEYAVAVFQDVNGNGVLDQDFFGRPREPFGISGNPDCSKAPPKYEDAKFSVNKPATRVAIRIQQIKQEFSK